MDISDRGHVVVRPEPEKPSQVIDLFDLTQHLEKKGFSSPVLVRFSGILRHRLQALLDAFDQAAQSSSYSGAYTAVYPIKVNQQRSVVETISTHPSNRVGLEVGSKPELLVAIAASVKGGTIICNGYKDREFIQLALVAQRLGFQVFIVIDKYSELKLILEESAKLSVKPNLGLRVRLRAVSAGNWQNTGGEKSKFGLTASEVLKACHCLLDNNMADRLRMLHFHLGSQIPNINDIDKGMKEACQYYAQLVKKGMDVSYINVGGGLGVDYEGTRSRSYCSMNYSLQDYADTVTTNMVEVCDSNQLPHPTIVTESGRAMTAHHAVLITQVIDTEKARSGLQDNGDDTTIAPLKKLRTLRDQVQDCSVLECYEQASQQMHELEALYSRGELGLEQRAVAESIYIDICQALADKSSISNRSHRALLDTLNERLADKLFCNFSLFQSIPDQWAIEQVFPILPLNKLEQEPTQRGTVHDMTCDSDGRVGAYIDNEGVEASLPVHEIEPPNPYYLGIFLVGAYQEILGDMHNLFGDTNSVHAEIDDNGQCHLSNFIQGDTVEDVIKYVHFDIVELRQRYGELIAETPDLQSDEASDFNALLEDGLKGYTYFEH